MKLLLMASIIVLASCAYHPGVDVKVVSNPGETKAQLAELQGLYGSPTMKILSFVGDDGRRVTFRRYRFEVDPANYVIADVCNGELIMVDTLNVRVGQ